MNWNYDMHAAPRGEWFKESFISKKGEPYDVSHYKHVRLILGGACGTVTVSRWLPLEERWEMFSKKETPIAWMPWPEAPQVQS